MTVWRRYHETAYIRRPFIDRALSAPGDTYALAIAGTWSKEPRILEDRWRWEEIQKGVEECGLL